MNAILSVVSDNSPAIDARATFDTTVANLGALSGQGKDALPMLALAIVRAASDGIVRVDRKADIDDSADIFSAFAAAEGFKMQHERSTASLKTQISKVRTCIPFGMLRMGAPDVVEMSEHVSELHAADKASDQPRFHHAYNAFLNVYRKQLRAGPASPLSDDEIVAAMTRKVTVKDTLAKIRAVESSLAKIVEGSENVEPADDSDDLTNALASIRNRIATLERAESDSAFVQEAAARGYQVVKFGQVAYEG
jgi:hypothetical protein